MEHALVLTGVLVKEPNEPNPKGYTAFYVLPPGYTQTMRVSAKAENCKALFSAPVGATVKVSLWSPRENKRFGGVDLSLREVIDVLVADAPGLTAVS